MASSSATPPAETNYDPETGGDGVPVSVSDGVHTSDPYPDSYGDPGLFPTPPGVPVVSGTVDVSSLLKAFALFTRNQTAYRLNAQGPNPDGYNNLLIYSRSQDEFIAALMNTLQQMKVL